MKGLLYFSLVLVGVVIIQELAYIGETSLAWVIIALAVALGAQAIYLMKKDKD